MLEERKHVEFAATEPVFLRMLVEKQGKEVTATDLGLAPSFLGNILRGVDRWRIAFEFAAKQLYLEKYGKPASDEMTVALIRVPAMDLETVAKIIRSTGGTIKVA